MRQKMWKFSVQLQMAFSERIVDNNEADEHFVVLFIVIVVALVIPPLVGVHLGQSETVCVIVQF